MASPRLPRASSASAWRASRGFSPATPTMPSKGSATAPCDTLVAVASGRVARVLKRRPFVERLQNWLSGAILIGLGAFVALAKPA